MYSEQNVSTLYNTISDFMIIPVSNTNLESSFARLNTKKGSDLPKKSILSKFVALNWKWMTS